MSRRSILFVAGAVVFLTGLAMLSPVLVSVLYEEWSQAARLLGAAAITVGAGLVAMRIFHRPGELSVREAFAAVGLSWLGISLVGALPYLLTGSITSVTDAVFESASGFTATGATVVADPALLSHGVLFWRSLTQWLGGMGVIVLSIGLLPLLGLGAAHLARAESPGPMPERLTPRFRDTAQRFWMLYAGITLVQVILLTVGDMDVFEAVAHAFTTISGGGFGTDARSLGAFSAYSQWVVVVFMLAGATSFALHHRGLRDPRAYLRSTEFKLFLGVVAAGSAVTIIGTWGGSVATTVRDAVFTVSSIVTTTGYATADFALWVPYVQLVIIGLMFVGGMTGSTSGSVKVYRYEVLVGAERSYVGRLLRPRRVRPVMTEHQAVPHAVVESVRTFFLLYMFAFMTGTALLGLIAGVGGPKLDLVSIASAVASCLGNVGPGLAELGPTHTYEIVPALGKWLLALLMIVGRLEILPIVILFNREAWRS